MGVLNVVAEELCYNLGGKGCTGNPVTSVQTPFSLTLVRDFLLQAKSIEFLLCLLPYWCCTVS